MTSIRAKHLAADAAHKEWDRAGDLLDSARTREHKAAFAEAEHSWSAALGSRLRANAALRDAAWTYQDDESTESYDALIACALAAHATDAPVEKVIGMEIALRYLWDLALKQPEFTNFCDEVVVTARKALTGAA